MRGELILAEYKLRDYAAAPPPSTAARNSSTALKTRSRCDATMIDG
jgi:hypothetical protein